MSDEIRRAVDEAYERIGRDGSLPPAGMDFPTGGELAKKLGYPALLIDALPARALASFVGAAPLVNEIMAAGGDSLVADCGCGSGVDSLLLALAGRKVASMDAQPAMLRRLVHSASEVSLPPGGGVLPVLARLPRIPLADGGAGWLIMNGVANLIPERGGLLREAARVLAPGGRLLIADVVALTALPEEVRSDAQAWAWCVAGAATPGEWLDALSGAGFERCAVEVVESFPPLGRGIIRAAAPG